MMSISPFLCSLVQSLAENASTCVRPSSELPVHLLDAQSRWLTEMWFAVVSAVLLRPSCRRPPCRSAVSACPLCQRLTCFLVARQALHRSRHVSAKSASFIFDSISTACISSTCGGICNCVFLCAIQKSTPVTRQGPASPTRPKVCCALGLLASKHCNCHVYISAHARSFS